ncbi:hypothetical protein Tco_1294787 [Tanacetum coccineum]
MEECHKLLTNQVDDRLLKYNISRPLPLGGPPGQVMIQTEFFFNRDLDYLRFGSKGDRLALSITKMKAAYYPDVGLERWFQIRCGSKKSACITFLQLMIDLRRADNQEYTIAENDFKDSVTDVTLRLCTSLLFRNLVIRQRVEDFQLGIESYQTQLNLTKPRWEATGLEFMHDYKILDSLRAIVFRDKYGMQMIMRFNEIHKFSDGTLQQIDEALDNHVKEFNVNKVNPGLNTRFWTMNDVIKSKQFMFSIHKRLKLRRIFQNLENVLVCKIHEETTDFFKRQNDEFLYNF